MKVFSYSQARQRLAEVLDLAREEEVMIRRRGGDTYTVSYKALPKSPFDVPCVKTKATTKDVLDAIKESRARARGEKDTRNK